MATGGRAKQTLLGTWRLVETELWDLDDLDLIEQAYLMLEPRGHGRLGLLAIEATLDYRVVRREGLPAIAFSFEGSKSFGRSSRDDTFALSGSRTGSRGGAARSRPGDPRRFAGRPERILKPMGWVVDMRHYLDEETGDLPDRLPTPVLNLALFFGSIIAWVTDHLPQGDWHTSVPS